MERKKIAEFQSRLKGLTLGHGTSKSRAESIRKEGLIHDYNYACVDEGWEMHEGEHYNLLISASAVADRTYPDPEGQWGPHPEYNMRDYVETFGLEATLDILERCFNGDGWLEDFGGDLTDPSNYNLVIIGRVPPEAILA